MSHDRFHDRLLELAYGELSPREARELEAHAESCADCGAELGRIRATRRIMGALPDERAPDAGERILLAAAHEAVRDRKPRRLLPAWAWSASVVAALVVTVGSVSYRLLAMRPAAERPGEELLGRGPYAEAPPAPEPAEDEAPKAQASPSTAAPAQAPHAPAPPRVAKPSAPPRSKGRALADAREEPARKEAAPAAPAPASPPAERAVASAARPPEAPPAGARDERARRAAEADVEESYAPEEAAGFAEPPPREPPPRMAEAPSRSEIATSRSRSAGAPAAASAPAPRAPAAPEAAAAAPDRSAAALARYSELRAAGLLSAELRTFTDCEGESWRKVERDPEGRIVRYVREGRVAGRRVRVEHLFGADGGLAAVRVRDLDRGGAVIAPGALGLSTPRDASEAGPDAEPRCER
jgi:hypothetical protein